MQTPPTGLRAFGFCVAIEEILTPKRQVAVLLLNGTSDLPKIKGRQITGPVGIERPMGAIFQAT